jgi:hypothetical protein
VQKGGLNPILEEEVVRRDFCEVSWMRKSFPGKRGRIEMGRNALHLERSEPVPGTT